MIPRTICKALIILFGVMYPAYSSYKTVKNKHVKNYVKWMMYWIVFSAFICIECLTDVFLEFWFPFYYDIKLLIVLWICCPFTKGSTIIYKQLVHPTLLKKETDIDDFLINVKSRTYNALVSTTKQTFFMATAIIMENTSIGHLSMMPILKQIANLENEKSSQEALVPVVKKIQQKNQTVVISEDNISDSYFENDRTFNKNPTILMDVLESTSIQRPKRTKVVQPKSNINRF